MRVQFGKRIYFCTLATKSNSYILLTTNNGIYTVICETLEEAEGCFRQLLTHGYYNFSEYQYSN